jgi:hypothetical protein
MNAFTSWRSSIVKGLAGLALVMPMLAIADPIRAEPQSVESLSTDGHADVVLHEGDDSAAIAEMLGVLRRDAVAFVEGALAAGQLEVLLLKNEPESFAGLIVAPSPPLHVTVLSTSPDPTEVEELAREAGVPPEVVTIDRVGFSLEELDEAAQAILDQRGDLNFDLSIVTRENGIDVVAANEATAAEANSIVESMNDIPIPASKIHVTVGVVAEPTVDIYGGLRLDMPQNLDCTSGFSVEGPSGGDGTSTAAHCSNSATFLGLSLDFQDGDMSGGQDVQWFKTPDISDKPWARDGDSTARTIRHKLTRAEMPIGLPFCKYGLTTHYVCGQIYDKSYAPGYINNPTATFILGYDRVEMTCPSRATVEDLTTGTTTPSGSILARSPEGP